MKYRDDTIREWQVIITVEDNVISIDRFFTEEDTMDFYFNCKRSFENNETIKIVRH